jgi:hypothetical protein
MSFHHDNLEKNEKNFSVRNFDDHNFLHCWSEDIGIQLEMLIGTINPLISKVLTSIRSSPASQERRKSIEVYSKAKYCDSKIND